MVASSQVWYMCELRLSNLSPPFKPDYRIDPKQKYGFKLGC